MLLVSAERLKRTVHLPGLSALDAEKLPFRDQAFEGVVCVRLASHVPPHVRLRVLSEMRRVTAKWIIVTYYLSNAPTDLKRKIKYSLRQRPRCWFPISERGVDRELADAGFRVVGKVPVCNYLSEASMIVGSSEARLLDNDSNSAQATT